MQPKAGWVGPRRKVFPSIHITTHCGNEEIQERSGEVADQGVHAGVERGCRWGRRGRIWEGSAAAAGSIWAAGEPIGLLWEHMGLVLLPTYPSHC